MSVNTLVLNTQFNSQGMQQGLNQMNQQVAAAANQANNTLNSLLNLEKFKMAMEYIGKGLEIISQAFQALAEWARSLAATQQLETFARNAGYALDDLQRATRNMISEEGLRSVIQLGRELEIDSVTMDVMLRAARALARETGVDTAEAFNTLADAVKNGDVALSELVDKAAEFNDVGPDLAENIGRIETSFKRLTDAIIYAIDFGIGPFADTFDSLVDRAETALSYISRKFQELGPTIGGTIAQGIKSGIAAVIPGGATARVLGWLFGGGEEGIAGFPEAGLGAPMGPVAPIVQAVKRGGGAAKDIFGAKGTNFPVYGPEPAAAMQMEEVVLEGMILKYEEYYRLKEQLTKEGEAARLAIIEASIEKEKAIWAQLGQAMSDFVQQGYMMFATSIGQMMAGQMVSTRAVLGQLATMLGTIFVSIGFVMLAANEAFMALFTGPAGIAAAIGLIAAGGALVALGAYLQASASKAAGAGAAAAGAGGGGFGNAPFRAPGGFLSGASTGTTTGGEKTTNITINYGPMVGSKSDGPELARAITDSLQQYSGTSSGKLRAKNAR